MGRSPEGSYEEELLLCLVAEKALRSHEQYCVAMSIARVVKRAVAVFPITLRAKQLLRQNYRGRSSSEG